MKTSFPLIFLFHFLFIITIQAQDSSSKKSFVKFNANYLSNAIYFARKDSSAVPYLRPSVTYNDKSGFSAGAGLSLLLKNNEPIRVDMVNIDGGYNFSRNNFYAGVYASKFFYNNTSFAVASELKGMMGIYLGYNLGPLTVAAGGDLLFSANTDISANLSISHEFETGAANHHWTFAPAVHVNAGTQFFNEAYYEFRKFTFPVTSGNSGSGSSNSGKGNSGKGHSNSNNGSGSSSSSSSTVKTLVFYDRNRFTILDVELSVPVNYENKNWGVYANPVIALPTNPATYTIDNSLQKEKLSTAFFTEIGLYIKL